MANEVVLDASAMLAILKRERGADRVLAVLNRAMVSCVNLAEVQTKLVDAGLDPAHAWASVTFLGCRGIPFGEEQARESGTLVTQTKSLGLSLGDRACLALAIERKAKVYTADRNWKSLSVGIEIEVIR
jgi:PIN domain nuclease of toxin-antitoxin system